MFGTSHVKDIFTNMSALFDEVCSCFQRFIWGQKQYFYISTSKSWEDARYHCRQHHTDLAMIEDGSENTAVVSVLVPDEWTWIGLYRQAWRWSDGSDSQFKNWWSGEPNNADRNQHCALEHGHKWDDILPKNSIHTMK
uniref:C-type lectin domain-containing protein n=1 Tax=Neogobius melanostomus TaxID=47308 RepID=A0A8C6SE84_9GOBI